MPLMLDMVYRHIPTGGVSRPIIEQRIMTTPNCTGSIWYCATIGINTGIVITRTAIPSMKQPRISKIKMKIAMTTFALVPNAVFIYNNAQ